MIKIYTLEHPTTKEIRYIGKTKYSLNDRLCKHLITQEKNHRSNWIRSLTKKGLKPKIKLIEEIPEDIWIETEIYWIEQFRQWGFKLVNATKGGESGIISPQCRKAQIEAIRHSKFPQWKRDLAMKKLSKPVQMLDKNNNVIKNFKSMGEATRFLDVENGSGSHISECCNEKRKTAYGYKWKFIIKI